MSTSQFAVYQLKKKPELRNLLFRTYEELAKDQIPVQMENYEQVYLEAGRNTGADKKGAGEETAAQL